MRLSITHYNLSFSLLNRGSNLGLTCEAHAHSCSHTHSHACIRWHSFIHTILHTRGLACTSRCRLAHLQVLSYVHFRTHTSAYTQNRTHAIELFTRIIARELKLHLTTLHSEYAANDLNSMIAIRAHCHSNEGASAEY